MSAPLSADYRDPEQTLIDEQAREVYRERGCVACTSFDNCGHGLPCKLSKVPGREWCDCFEEA